MATRAIKPKRDDTMLTGWQSTPERAPSVVRDDKPTITRFLASFGLLLCAVGTLAMLAPLIRFPYRVNPVWGGFCLSMGLGLLLFHAFSDKEPLFRRMYGALALTLVLIAVAMRIFPFARFGNYFLPLGVPGLFLALLFFVGILRNETDKFWRTFHLALLGALGAVMLLVGAVLGQFSMNFLIDSGEGILMLLLGTGYFSAFIGCSDSDDVAYWAGLALGTLGLATFAVALVRSLAPESEFLVPTGFALMAFAALWIVIALGVVSDLPLVVLVRRELASYFYSPVAYLVIVALMVIAWLSFVAWLRQLMPSPDPRMAAYEPIVGGVFINLFAVFAVMFIVPVLTMRLVSEERRSGTLEVLLTAPVNEPTIILSKFFGAYIFYMLTWTPYWLFLVGLRVIGGESFDYRPVLSFALVLMATGAGFIAMGLFFSTLTSNQIIAAVLSFVGMMLHLATYMMKWIFEIRVESIWSTVLMYMSFIDLWFNALEGHLAPRFLVFHLSAAILFLYLSVKVLEARKWK